MLIKTHKNKNTRIAKMLNRRSAKYAKKAKLIPLNKSILLLLDEKAFKEKKKANKI